MRPFHQFRVWLHRGARGEQAVAAVAVILAVVLAAWALIPLDDDEPATAVPADEAAVAGPAADAPAAGGPTATSPGATVPGGPTSAPAPGSSASVAASSSPGAEPVAVAAADRCAELRATDVGVTASEVFVAVPLVDLAGPVGNTAFNIRSDMEAVTAAVVAGINADGGVACRKLRAKTYRVNPLDQNDTRSKCLQIVGDKPFAVVDLAGYVEPVDRDCFPEHKVPFTGAVSIGEEEFAKYSPYLFSFQASIERQLRNWVNGAGAMGAFDPAKGFKKLGVFINACYPKAHAELRQVLQKFGVSDDELSWYTMNCELIAPPNEVAAAVAQHRRDNVSHVFLGSSLGSSQNYVKAADGVSWRPQYLVSDYGSNTNGLSANGFPDGMDKAVGITSTRSGEGTSGIGNAQRDQCNGWLKKAGVQPANKDGDTAYAMCDEMRLFAAAGNALGPNLVRTGLTPALARVGRIPFGGATDGIYDRPGKLWGGDLIRAVQWHRDCKCWRVIDRDLRPGY